MDTGWGKKRLETLSKAKKYRTPSQKVEMSLNVLKGYLWILAQKKRRVEIKKEALKTIEITTYFEQV